MLLRTEHRVINPNMKGRLFDIQQACTMVSIHCACVLKGFAAATCGATTGRHQPKTCYPAMTRANVPLAVPVCEHAPHAHSIQSGQHLYDQAGCNGCGRCAEACLFGALELAGYKRIVGEVMDTVRRDAPFYRGVGGLTITRRRAHPQGGLCHRLGCAAHAEGISVCVETCGYSTTRAANACSLYGFVSL